MASVLASNAEASSTIWGESPGTAAVSDSWTASSCSGVLGRHRGGAGERGAQLGVADLAGHADHDGTAGLLVEGEYLEPGRLALDHEAEGGLAELAGEGLPGRAHEREQFVAVGADLGDKPARGRRHQRLGRLVDAEHWSILWQSGRSGLHIGRKSRNLKLSQQSSAVA